jgi:hypothetical protein
VISGQRPKAAAIAYEVAQGKSREPAMSTKASDREKRRAASLRQNLRRRKAAARKPAVSGTLPTCDAAPEKAPERPNKAQKPL